MSIVVLKFEQRPHNGKLEDWVLYGPGDDVQKTQTWVRVSQIIPPETFKRDNQGIKQAAMQALWSAIGPQYEAWKAGVTVPETGTPLAMWPLLEPEQIKALQSAGIRSLEDLKDAGESHMSKVNFPGSKRLPSLAAEFMESKSKSDLVEQLAAQQRQIEELTAQISKPRRGRPPKDAAA